MGKPSLIQHFGQALHLLGALVLGVTAAATVLLPLFLAFSESGAARTAASLWIVVLVHGVLLGIPGHFLYRWRGWSCLSRYLLLGVAIGAVPAGCVLLLPLLAGLQSLQQVPFVMAIALVILSPLGVAGGLAGAVFWWVCCRPHPLRMRKR